MESLDLYAQNILISSKTSEILKKSMTWCVFLSIQQVYVRDIELQFLVMTYLLVYL